ncbi:MAG: zinc transporter ZupT [Acidobacteria bacterium]|nr:zinc transporter ZupT [Acidobacteriota bacterium]
MVHSLTIFTSGELRFAFSLTLVAGLVTGLGSALAFFAKRTHLRFLAWSLAFSAGVMLYVSFVDILPKSAESLGRSYPGTTAALLSNLGFFGGLIFMAIIDALVPKAENPHELRAEADLKQLKANHGTDAQPGVEHQQLRRMGLFTAMAIAIHNFPEGMATFLSALEDPATGVAIAIAISLHNIPEGISVSVPIFFATGRRGRAFVYSFLSGLAEPVGGLVAALMLGWLLPPKIIGLIFAGVAGIMVYISIDELLPTARQYGKSHEVLAGIVGGMAVMAASLLLLKS